LRDLIKKIAVYKSKLAVQLTDKVIVYEVESADSKDMNYKPKRSISKKFECNLFVITWSNFIICQVNVLVLPL
jgi:intraflagellar transport protein 122